MQPTALTRKQAAKLCSTKLVQAWLRRASILSCRAFPLYRKSVNSKVRQLIYKQNSKQTIDWFCLSFDVRFATVRTRGSAVLVCSLRSVFSPVIA